MGNSYADSVFLNALGESGQGVAIFNSNLKLISSNHVFHRMFDLYVSTSQTEVNWDTFSSLVKESDCSFPCQWLLDNDTAQITVRDPNQRYLRLRRSELPEKQTLLLCEDITQDHILWAAQQQQAEEFHSYLELSPVGAILVGMNKEIRYMNRRLLEIFGYQKEEAGSFSVLDLYANPNDRQILISKLNQSDKPVSFHTFGKRKNGISFPMLLTSQLISFEGEQHIFSWVNDLSSLNEAQETIKRISERYQLILAAAGTGILELDDQNVIQYANPSAIKTLGYEVSELELKPLNFVLDAQSNLTPSDNDTIEGEARLIRSDQSRLSVKFMLSPLPGHADGGKVFVFDDISDRLSAEATLRQAMTDIENTSRAKSNFLSTMSHELRTPMNAILGFAQILKGNKDDNLNEQQLNFIDHIFKAGDHLLKLIDEAIDIATIESGKAQLSLQSIEVAEIVKASIPSIDDMMKDAEVTLTIDPGVETKELYVIADYARLQQVLQHLLSNAVKYNRRNGKITIACARNDDGYVRISVADTGRGISAKYHDTIFEPFNRLRSASEGISGTGLGLTVSKYLITLMKGKIDFVSSPDEGTRFWVDLPQSEKDAPLFIPIDAS